MSNRLFFSFLKFSLVAAFMLFLQVGFSQKRLAAVSAFPAVDKAIEEKKNLFGKDVSVVIAVADSTVYQKFTGDPANIRTPVPIGASSQWLTTALIMQLVDEGKISLDDPVSKYLPPFELYRRNYVTIRHCLTHETGLGKEGFKLAAFFEKKKFNSLEEEVTDLLKKEIHANAGEEFRYNNNGMVIAARVAEVVTKKRFDQLIRTKLFVPLGMRNTTFTTDDGSAPNPSSGAKSTAADYAKFLQMLLNKGKAGDKQILSEASVAEMRKVQVPQDEMKGIPKGMAGDAFTLGSWATEGANAKEATATVLILPGWNGTWASVDFARGYTFVVTARDFSGDQNVAVYEELKRMIDQKFPVKNK
jgi:CubicO group peptidase (beta-lactamase class C family)